MTTRSVFNRAYVRQDHNEVFNKVPEDLMIIKLGVLDNNHLYIYLCYYGGEIKTINIFHNDMQTFSFSDIVDHLLETNSFVHA